MAMRVILKSPYGRFKNNGVGTPIPNGRRGWTTGAYSGKKPMVMFDHRTQAVAVPEHWITYAPSVKNERRSRKPTKTLAAARKALTSLLDGDPEIRRQLIARITKAAEKAPVIALHQTALALEMAAME